MLEPAKKPEDNILIDLSVKVSEQAMSTLYNHVSQQAGAKPTEEDIDESCGVVADKGRDAEIEGSTGSNAVGEGERERGGPGGNGQIS